MPPRIKSVSWARHDSAVALGQGDLVLVAWTKTIGPAEQQHSSGLHPQPGAKDALDLRLWDDGPPGVIPVPVLEMWGRHNYSIAVVLSEGCAIDKEYNILRQQFEISGLEPIEARKRALDEAVGFITIAEAWPVESFPPHLKSEAEGGATGYVPFYVPNWTQDSRPFAVDLNRISTVSWRSLDTRIAVAEGDAAWRQRIQSGVCRHFASRTIRITSDLQEIFQAPILSAEAVGVPAGSPPRVRVRLHFENGRCEDLEAIQGSAQPDVVEADRGPDLQTRR
jgi:hypothetical protein